MTASLYFVMFLSQSLSSRLVRVSHAPSSSIFMAPLSLAPILFFSPCLSTSLFVLCFMFFLLYSSVL